MGLFINLNTWNCYLGLLLGEQRCKHLQSEDISHQDWKVRDGLESSLNGDKYFIVTSNLRLRAFWVFARYLRFKYHSDLFPAIVSPMRNIFYRKMLKVKSAKLWLAVSHQECVLWSWEKTGHTHQRGEHVRSAPDTEGAGRGGTLQLWDLNTRLQSCRNIFFVLDSSSICF